MVDELPIHWRFASAQAFTSLRELVQSFDFRKFAGKATYVGLPPSYLIDVIDGFLSENGNVVWGGNRAELLTLRQELMERIVPTYELGADAGKKRWEAGDRTLETGGVEQLHALSLQLGPADPLLSGWFAEGFCVAYSSAWLESQRAVV